MSYRGLVADPEGLLIFDQPTDVRVHGKGGYSTASVTVIPYSALLDGDDQLGADGTVELWIGGETYYVPADAEYTTVTDFSLNEATTGLATMTSPSTTTQRAAESGTASN